MRWTVNAVIHELRAKFGEPVHESAPGVENPVDNARFWDHARGRRIRFGISAQRGLTQRDDAEG
jgi:hypothetical protein